MKESSTLICNISDSKDLKKITRKTKYINLFLDKISNDVLSYFIENGSSLSYAESFTNISGYIYVDYDTFIKGETKIKEIIESMPKGLTDLEKIRYIYICLGNILSYDINTILEKNDNFMFENYSIINNLWGSLSTGKVTNLSVVKIFKYICNLLKIECEIIITNDYGYLCNKVIINGQTIIVDLMKDIPYIQAKFSTKYFSAYNSDVNLDKNIGYIKENYNDSNLDERIKTLLHNEKFNIYSLLMIIQQSIDVEKIKPIELGIILEDIFQKYYPIQKVVINNLYINDIYGNKEHFILISCNEKHYSYNFRKKSFVEVSKDELINNLESKKIGVYLDEEIPDLEIYNTKSMI